MSLILIPFKDFTLFMGVEKQSPTHGLESVPELVIAFPWKAIFAILFLTFT